MLFIAIGTDVQPELFGPFMAEEGAVLRELQEQGTVKAAYKSVAGGRVFSLVEASTAGEAARHLSRLPLVREGLLVIELIEVARL